MLWSAYMHSWPFGELHSYIFVFLYHQIHVLLSNSCQIPARKTIPAVGWLHSHCQHRNTASSSIKYIHCTSSIFFIYIIILISSTSTLRAISEHKTHERTRSGRGTWNPGLVSVLSPNRDLGLAHEPMSLEGLVHFVGQITHDVIVTLCDSKSLTVKLSCFSFSLVFHASNLFSPCLAYSTNNLMQQFTRLSVKTLLLLQPWSCKAEGSPGW